MKIFPKTKALMREKNLKMSYMKWLGHYSKPFLGRIVLVTLINILISASGLAIALLSKKIIDHAVAGQNEPAVTVIILYAVVIILIEVFGIAQTLLRTMLNERVSFGIRRQLYERILKAEWGRVQEYHSGDLMTRLTSDAGTIADGVVSTVPEMVSLLAEMIMVFLTLYYYSAVLAVFALVIGPAAVGMAWWLGRRLKKLQIKVQETESAYRSFLQESIANLLIVKAFTNEKYAADRLTKLREERFYWVFRRTGYGMVSSVVMSASFHIGYLVALTYGAMQISAGAITYGTMSVFLTLVNRVQAPVMQLANQVPRVVAVFASVGRVMEVDQLPEESGNAANGEKSGTEEKEEESPRITEKLQPRCPVGVNIESLTFGYTQEPVLKNVTMKVEPGETVAVMGESGIGKTTLIRLIMAFLKSDRGNVRFYDGKGWEEAADADSRRFIAYVPQGNTLFSGTIRENIRMGRLDASEDEMWEVLEQTAGRGFVQSLPNGLDTVIGEKGYGLSEGQAQRLAIARALIRKAPVLILDEATSALDEATELEVLQGIRRTLPKPTCLVVTHRRSVLKYCDREIRIDKGELSEQSK
ncbi:MAG: ABC transporter ATP-binding protein [Lachnospiraceae bacterium]|nr:ABC transporter ATP-binding protein [Lachnospiraceae bacterium]